MRYEECGRLLMHARMSVRMCDNVLAGWLGCSSAATLKPLEPPRALEPASAPDCAHARLL